MSEWRRQWVITLRWDNPANSPYGQDQRVFTVGARELGEMIRAARVDPHIVGYPYEARWERHGDEPAFCPAGHPFGGGSVTRPIMGWYDCDGCPGHAVYRCRACPTTGGPQPTVDPPPGPNCWPRPRAPATRPARLKR